jgi:hypothetical protein
MARQKAPRLAPPTRAPDEPWPIEWYICRANHADVAHAATTGRKLVVGQELWRTAKSVGPITCDHNHWGGEHIAGEPEEITLAAWAPALLGCVQKAAAGGDMAALALLVRLKAAGGPG